MSTVAWIGLGQMGRPMAANLVAAGHTVLGVEINEENARAAAADGVTVVGTVEEAVRTSEAIFTMLPNGDLVRSVLAGPDGVLVSAGERLVVDCSTIDIATAAELHEIAREAGVSFADAPVSGGVTGARAGKLTFMVGAGDEHIASISALLAPMAGKVVHVGGPTVGQAMKIVNNLMVGITLAGVCEGALLSDRLGLDPHVVHDVVTTSTSDSWVFRAWCPLPGVVGTAPSSHDFAAGFSTELLLKDLGLALQAAKGAGLKLATGEVAAGLYQKNATQGRGALDCSSLMVTLEQAYPRLAEQAGAAS